MIAWLAVVAWAAVIFAFSATPNLSTGLGGWDLVLRKLAHMAEYGVLAILLARATGRAWLTIVLAALYAVSDEWHQTFVEGRRGSPVDVLIDTAGATIGIVLWRLVPWRRWWRRRGGRRGRAPVA